MLLLLLAKFYRQSASEIFPSPRLTFSASADFSGAACITISPRQHMHMRAHLLGSPLVLILDLEIPCLVHFRGRESHFFLLDSPSFPFPFRSPEPCRLVATTRATRLRDVPFETQPERAPHLPKMVVLSPVRILLRSSTRHIYIYNNVPSSEAGHL